MSTTAYRNFFTPRQLLQSVLVILITVTAILLAGLAVDYGNVLGLVLLALTGVGAVIAGLLTALGRTGQGLCLTLAPVACLVAIILFARGDGLGIAGGFIWQNIALAWQSLTNR